MSQLRLRNVVVNRIHQLAKTLARLPSPPASSACSALPITTGKSSPGKSNSLSTRALQLHQLQKLLVVHHVHLVQKHHVCGTFTCRASKMCSRVCGIGPSAALTTKIAPSICAAPVIMFFT